MSLVGTVDVAGKSITFGELSLAEEWKLGTLLVQLYVKERGDAYTRNLDKLNKMDPRDRSVYIAEFARADFAGESPGPEAKGEARLTPKGVALELWMRAKRYHPDLKREEVETIITDVNCLDVLGSIITQMTPPPPKEGGGDESKS